MPQINNGADVNCRDDAGRSPLHVACLAEDADKAQEVILRLVEAGADGSIRDRNASTPLHLVAKAGW